MQPKSIEQDLASFSRKLLSFFILRLSISATFCYFRLILRQSSNLTFNSLRSLLFARKTTLSNPVTSISFSLLQYDTTLPSTVALLVVVNGLFCTDIGVKLDLLTLFTVFPVTIAEEDFTRIAVYPTSLSELFVIVTSTAPAFE